MDEVIVVSCGPYCRCSALVLVVPCISCGKAGVGTDPNFNVDELVLGYGVKVRKGTGLEPFSPRVGQKGR